MEEINTEDFIKYEVESLLECSNHTGISLCDLLNVKKEMEQSYTEIGHKLLNNLLQAGIIKKSILLNTF